MSEETTAQVPPTDAPEQAVAEEAAVSVSDASAESTSAELPAWMTAVSTADGKELRKHPKVAGIIGSELDRARKQWEAEAQAKVQRDAADRRRDELLEKARTAPVEFADEFLTEHEKREQARAAAAEVTANYNKLGEEIGRGLEDIPEWMEMEPEERHAEMAKALQGLPPGEKLLGKFVATATAMIAKRAIAKAREKDRAEFNAKERAAIEQEVTARFLANGRQPSIARAAGAGDVDLLKLSDKDFNEAYERRFLR